MKQNLKLYEELASWWPLLSAPEDYAQEAEVFKNIFQKYTPAPKTMLELGSGGGNNALHMKKDFEMTLTDISEGMLEVSRKLNPECEHVKGDMRDLRLNKTFGAVFVHDAIAYMTTEEDLKRVFQTAFLHCKEGGLALFVPDWVKETFVPYTDHGGEDSEGKSLRYLEWVYDPDSTDSVYNVEFAIITKDGDDVKVELDRHIDGIFPKQTWLNLIKEVGFNPEAIADPHEENRTFFVGRKP